MTILRVDALRVSFGGVQAVRGVSFGVAEGEAVGVIGPNGAGKTTLFDLLSGHEKPEDGEVVFGTEEITGALPERLAALGIARTFQHGRVFGNLSVLDNVLVGASARLRQVRPSVRFLGPVLELLMALARPARVRTEEAALRDEAVSLLHLFGDRLLPRQFDLAHSLSYANRRRLEIARALALRPRLLLLDEPAAGMNESETLELLSVLATLKARGLTMLLIEHKLELVMRLCDRVLVMDDGTVIAQGDPDSVRYDPAVIEAYLGHRAAGAGADAIPQTAL